MDVGLEQAVLAFRDIALKLYSINVGIVVENPVDRWPMPSVLGMDVLSRWRVTLEPREGVFEIEPKNADLGVCRSQLRGDEEYAIHAPRK